MAATDVRMAALAEAVWGAAKGKKYFAWVTIGTGYGGYLFLNGLPYRGLHGYAGNFGHNTWDEFNGDYCGCGNKGCVETFVSGPSIAKSGQALYDAGQMPIFDEMPHEEPISTRDVFSAAGKGDPGAISILEEAQRITAISLAGLVNTLDLEMLVIGGGVANGSPEYVASIDQKIRTYLMMDEAKRDLRVVKESLPNSALFGAAADVFIRSGRIGLI
jgi:glucokinase